MEDLDISHIGDRITGNQRYYVYGKGHDGRMRTLYGGNTEEEAQIVLDQLASGRIFRLNTTNLARAKGMVRGRLASEEDTNLDSIPLRTGSKLHYGREVNA